MNTAVKIHTPRMDKKWRNAAGDEVPFKFVPKPDQLREGLAGKLYRQALAAEQALQDLHKAMAAATEEVSALVREEYGIKESKGRKKWKGNITWFNFDKSLKIEADVQDVVRWDEAMMTEALILLKEYIGANLTEANELIKGLVDEAFSNSKGAIDTRKVFQLLKYRDRIKSQKFQKACELMTNAQGIDKTKLYHRIWEKMPDGSYRSINLNFSTI